MNSPQDSSPCRDPLLTVFVACYNEEGNIAATLNNVVSASAAARLDVEILVVDDASTDKSVEKIKSWMEGADSKSATLIVNQSNQGLAANYKMAAHLGKGRWFRLVCGDNVEPVATLIDIFKYVGTQGIILPYHTECSGKHETRVALSRLYTTMVNAITGRNIRYYNGLPVVLRTDAIRFCRPRLGFGFQAYLVTAVLDNGTEKVEIPVKTIERAHGKSNALTLSNMRGVVLTLLSILALRVRRVNMSV
jgi:glycosyltransferase involved in cell wall biosynthesis